MDRPALGVSLTVSTIPLQSATSSTVLNVKSTKRHVIVTEDDVIDLWCTVGTSRNLATDSDIARYLLSLYFTDRKSQCTCCNTPLTLFCVNCRLPSQQKVCSQLCEHTHQQETIAELSPEQSGDSKLWSPILSSDQALLSGQPSGSAALPQLSWQQTIPSQGTSQRLPSPALTSQQSTSSQCPSQGSGSSSLSAQKATSLSRQQTSVPQISSNDLHSSASEPDSSSQRFTQSRASSPQFTSQSLSTQQVVSSDDEAEADIAFESDRDDADANVVSMPAEDCEKNKTRVSKNVHNKAIISGKHVEQNPVVKLLRLDLPFKSHDSQITMKVSDVTDNCESLDSCKLHTSVEIPGGNGTRSRGPLKQKVHPARTKYPICDGKAYRDGHIPAGLDFTEYKCSQCGKEFFSKFEIVRHMKNLSCDGGDEAFVAPGKAPVTSTAQGSRGKNDQEPSDEDQNSDLEKRKKRKIHVVSSDEGTCDDDEDWEPDDDGMDRNSGKRRKQKVHRAQGSHKDDEDWQPGDEDEDSHSDSEKRELERLKPKISFHPHEKGFTAEEFMTGKIKVKRPPCVGSKYKRFSHFRCKRCCAVFVSKAEYKEHRTRTVAKESECTKREMPNAESIKILKEILDHLTVSCTKCSLIFRNKTHLQKHSKLHKTDIVCHLCGRIFSEKRLLQRHMKIPTEKQKCEVCDFSFQVRCQIRQHSKEHHREQQNKQCEICNMSFHSLNKWKIKRHMQEHRNVFQCEICKETVPNKKKLVQKHRKGHEEIKKVPCPICGKCFKPCRINQHVLIHSDSRPFVCTVCNAAFKTKSDLGGHSRRHGKKTKQCEYCGAEFYTAYALNTHLRSHFEKKFRCEECDIRLVTKKALDLHIDNVHRKISQHVCKICGHTVTDRATLKAHLRSHTGERPFQCKHCPAKFARQDYLTKHVRLHTGEKPYECEDCLKRFAVASSLKAHRKKHHSDKTYTCSLCGLDFLLRYSLDHHVKRQHGFPSIGLIDLDAKIDWKEEETLDKGAMAMDRTVLSSGNDQTPQIEKAD